MAVVGIWAALSYSLVIILTWAKISAPLRRLPRPFRNLFSCQLCAGFWIGLFLTFTGLGPALVLPWPTWQQAIANGLMCAPLCFVLHAIVMTKLGGAQLDASH